MAVADVLKVFRDLKREGTVQDHLLFGSVAAMAYTRPFFTQDVDIGVAVSDGQDFLRIFNRLADFGHVEGHSVVISGTPAEVSPIDISPVIQDALEHPSRKRVEGLVVKVAPAEHLLVESLRVYRSRDKARVFMLDDIVDRDRLRALFERLDHDGTLRWRYCTLVGHAP